MSVKWGAAETGVRHQLDGIQTEAEDERRQKNMEDQLRLKRGWLHYWLGSLSGYAV